MQSLTCHRAVRLTLIALYAIATVLVAATPPVRTQVAAAESAIVLPDGQVAVFCHSDAGDDTADGTVPGRKDHRACCATCLFAGAPGLGADFISSLSLPPAGNAVEAGFVISERIAIELRQPTSRGPPSA